MPRSDSFFRIFLFFFFFFLDTRKATSKEKKNVHSDKRIKLSKVALENIYFFFFLSWNNKSKVNHLNVIKKSWEQLSRILHGNVFFTLHFISLYHSFIVLEKINVPRLATKIYCTQDPCDLRPMRSKRSDMYPINIMYKWTECQRCKVCKCRA